MRIRLWPLTIAAFIAVAFGSAMAADRGTPEEAKALAQKGATHVAEVGFEKACADFDNPNGGYQSKDLFIFAYSAEGKVVCGANVPALIGRDVTKFKDVDGKEFGKEIIAAGTAGGGWVEYRMTHPVTKKIEAKKTYAVKAGDYILGCGAYVE